MKHLLCSFLMVLLASYHSFAATDVSLPPLYQLLLRGNQANSRFITSFGDAAISFGSMVSTIDISSNGKVFVNHFVGPVTSKQPVHVFDSDYSYLGTFEDSLSTTVMADTIVVDAADNLHTYAVNFGYISHKVFTPSGTVSADLSSSDNVHATKAIDRDNSGNNYVIPCCGSGTGATGRTLFVWKVSDDFSQLLESVDKAGMLAMLPSLTEENDVTLHDVKVLPNGDVAIAIDLSGHNESRDGLLILDSALNKKQYVGDNWLFNDPFSLDFDGKGNIYVASTYGNEIAVLNSRFEKISTITVDEIPIISLENDFLPTDLAIQGGKLYVLNARDDLIYVFDIH